MALEEWLPRNLYIVAGVFIVISLLQVWDVLSSVYCEESVLQLDVTLSTFIFTEQQKKQTTMVKVFQILDKL